ncbi:FRG domain-containing protein [Akkermansiaceae bacterium]|nr:FRG domain-containing protein [Akkermansiaceae bacterium]
MINEIEIEDIGRLIEILNKMPNHIIYRGQADARWGLTSSLERLLEPISKEEAFDFLKYEKFAIKEFTSRYHIYTQNRPEQLSRFEMLSFMQHYGTPTRLIDFSSSPYLALYFALESYNPLSQDDFSLYALDYKHIMSKTHDAIKNSDNKYEKKLRKAEDAGKTDAIFEKIVERFNLDLVWVDEPDIVNNRIERQAGTFITCLNRNKNTEEILNSEGYKECDMNKYIIHNSLYEGVFTLLRKMNISSRSVYGDLEGLGKAVKMELQAYARPM